MEVNNQHGFQLMRLPIWTGAKPSRRKNRDRHLEIFRGIALQ